MRNGVAESIYRVIAADFNADGLTDIATISPNAGGGWAEWLSVDLSTGSGFSSEAWVSSAPAHMRNGGPDQTYQVMAADF
ncbi:MAG TPA: hypothetical protein EYP07_06320, partial [Kiloniellaceae bacterium]|nr:hypothetical protein [Kiloniellaceae bacterium]